MTSFFKRLFGKKAREGPQEDEENGNHRAADEETDLSGRPGEGTSPQQPSSQASPSAPPGSTTISPVFTTPAPSRERDPAPPGKWRCSKCERVKDDQLENCSFCGAGKGE